MSDRTFNAIGFVVGLNFMIYMIVVFAIGGDAIHGKIADGHYYLGNRGHFRQVGHAVYLYSAVHTGVSMASVLAVVLIGLRRRKRKIELSQQRDDAR